MKIIFDISVGKIVKYLVFADLVFWAGWGLISPIFSIFIIERVAGATVGTVGVAAAIYWILKSLLQIPISRYLDRTPGERDDFYALAAGLLVAGFTAFSFLIVREIWQLYLTQIIQAFAFSLYFPSWMAIFSRHLDRDKVSFDWSLDSTLVGIAMGTAGLVGGLIAKYLGFQMVFLLTGLLAIVSVLILLTIPEVVLPHRRGPVPPPVSHPGGIGK